MSLKKLAARSQAAMARVDQAEAAPPAESDKTVRQPVSNAGAMMLLQPQIAAAERRAEVAEAKLGSALLVPLDRLVSVEGRRRRLTDEQFAQLRDNLAHNPLIQPIVVKRIDDDRFEVISGDNRLAAYRDLGRAEIAITISHELDSLDDAARAAFFANLLQPSLPDFEKFLGFKQEMERTGHTQLELAEQAGVSKALMSYIFSFAKLPTSITSVLANTPTALSASGALTMVAALESGRVTEGEAVELLNARIADGSSEADMLRKLSKPAQRKEARAVPSRMTFREGQATKCDVVSTPTGLRLEFKDVSDREWIETAVVRLLEEKYRRKS